MDSPLRGKPVYCREWVVQKLFYIASSRQQHNWSKKNGVIVLGGSGSGKTALLTELSWPTSNHAKQHSISRRVLARHFCHSHFWQSLHLASFVSNVLKQLKCSPFLPNFKDVLKDFPKEQYSFSAICANPDEVFRTIILGSLSVLNAQGVVYFLLVDSIDEDYETQMLAGDRTGSTSKTIADLLLNNLDFFPPWLCLLCSARKNNTSFIQRFQGFRKIILDDQEKRRQYVQKDMRGYICNRIECDNKLRVLFSNPDTRDLNVELLENKSDRCMLYLEWVLDGVQNGLIKFSEIKEIPGTLRGLYLWYCQHSFEKKTFSLVRPILNVLLASRISITETDLVDYLWSRNLQVPQDELISRLKLIECFLKRLPDNSFRIFHSSFSEWLLDVKYCTRHFLCDVNQGHATLALSSTCNLDNRPFDEDFAKDFAYDLAKSAPCHKLNSELCALWMAWSGVDVESAVTSPTPPKSNSSSSVNVFTILRAGGAYRDINNQSDNSDPMTSNTSVGEYSDSKETESEHAVRVMLDSNPASIAEHDSDGLTPLAKAAQRGSVKCVKVLVNAGADVNAENVNRQTALGLAAAAGHTNVVQFLLEKGANPNHVDADNWSPLRSAAQNGHASIIKLLVDYGADVNERDSSGKSALRLAAFSGSKQAVQYLIDGGANVNSEDHLGRTALIACAYAGHVDIVSLLLTKGAHIDHTDSAGHTALVFAFLNSQHERHADTVNILLDEKATVDYVNSDGMSPLGIAAAQGHSRIVELLLSRGKANAQFSDSLGRTALYHAVHGGQGATVVALINWGAQQDVVDHEGRSLLSLAALQGHVEVATILIEHSLDENHKDDNGCTPLHLSAAEGTVEMCHILLEAGARIDELDNDGKTPLIYAAESGSLTALKYLLREGADSQHTAHNGLDAFRFAALEERIPIVDHFLSIGCDIEIRDPEGRTVLYFLAQDNKVTMVRHLISRGANVNSVDNNGRSALIVAAWVGHLDMCQLLLEHGADCYHADHEGLTGLLMAAWENRKEVVELMLAYGADIEHACKQGATALVIAVQEGHLETVKYLLHHQADPQHEDEHGRNPMRIAVKNGHKDIIQLLEAYGSLPESANQNFSPTKRSDLGSSGSTHDTQAPALPSRGPLDGQQRNSRFLNSLSNKNTIRSEHRQSAALSISSDHFSCQSLGAANEAPNGGFGINQSATDPNISVSSSSANSSLDKRVISGMGNNSRNNNDNQGSLDSRNGGGGGGNSVTETEEQIYNHYDEPCSAEHTNTIGHNIASMVGGNNEKRSYPIDGSSAIISTSMHHQNAQQIGMSSFSPQQAPMLSGYMHEQSVIDIQGEHANEDLSHSYSYNQNYLGFNPGQETSSGFVDSNATAQFSPQQTQQPMSSQEAATEYLQMSILQQAWKQEQESREKQIQKKQRRLSVFGKISKVFRLSSPSSHGSNSKFSHPLFNCEMPSNFNSSTLNMRDGTIKYSQQNSPQIMQLSPGPLSDTSGGFFPSQPSPGGPVLSLHMQQSSNYSLGSQQGSMSAGESGTMVPQNKPSGFLIPQIQSGNHQHNHQHAMSPVHVTPSRANMADYHQFSPLSQRQQSPCSPVNRQTAQQLQPQQQQNAGQNSTGSTSGKQYFYPKLAAKDDAVKKSDYMRLVDLTHLQSYDHQAQMSNRILNYERKPQNRKGSLDSQTVLDPSRGSHLSPDSFPPVSPHMRAMNPSHDQITTQNPPSVLMNQNQNYQARSNPVYVTTPSIPIPRRPPPMPPTEPTLIYQKRAPPPLPRKPRDTSNLFVHTGGLSKAVPEPVISPNAARSPTDASSVLPNGQSNGSQPTSSIKSNYINHGEAARRAALCRKPKLETIIEPESSTGDFSRLSLNSKASALASPATSNNRRAKVETVI